ncbi:MAG: glycosyltransferase [Phycisphaeraceae bacterium]
MKDSVAAFFEKYGDDEQILKLALLEDAQPDDDPPPGGPGGGGPRGKRTPAAEFSDLPEIDSLDPFEELGVMASPMLRLTGDGIDDETWNTASALSTEIEPPLPHRGMGERTGTLRLTTDAPDEPSRPAVSPLTRPTILHVRVVAGTGGGPEKTILRSPRYADRDIYDMAVAYIYPKGDSGIEVIKAQAKQFDAPIITIPERGAFSLSTLVALYRLCKKLNVSVWHAHDYKSNLFGLMLRRFWKMKLVTTVHGWTNDTFRTRMYYHVDKWCLPRYDEVIAVSPPLMQQCIDIGVPKDRLTYIHNAIEPDDYQRQHTIREARHEMGIWPDAIVMGVVSRLSVEKGVDRAIDTLAALSPTYPKLELHIVGDGPEYDRVKKQAATLGVSERVKFWGWQSDSRRYFETFDFLLLPSHTEGFPNVVLEAMAMGVPVAATDVGGVSELLKFGRRGVILDPKHQDTWATHIAPLVVSEDRRSELSRQGRRRIEKYYSFAQRMEKVLAIYDRMLSIDPKHEETAWRRAA